MEPQLREEWSELQAKTCEHLRSRSHILQPKHRPVLQLLAMPSFEDMWCIDLVETAGEFSAFRTTWYSTQDVLAFENGLARLRYPRPFVATLESIRLDRSDSDVRHIINSFKAIDMPFDWLDSSISLDGTGYELSFHEGRILKWTNDVPLAWPTQLRQLIKNLLAWT